MKSKKLFVLALCAALTTSMFAGCGGSGSTGSSSSSAPAAPSESSASQSEAAPETTGEKTKLTVWHTWGAGPGLDVIQELASQYNASNDKNVEVSIDFVANQASGNTQTMDKLMASIAAGSPPEIAMLDNFQIATWAAQDALTTLDDLMKNEQMDFSDVYQWAQDGSIYKGSTYSIPYNGDARALFYNKDLFTAAGLDPENPPKTIAELEEAAEKLTIKDGSSFKQAGIVPWIFAGKPLYTWGWSFGGDFYDAENNVLTVANEKNIEALQWEVDFAKKFGITDFVNFASGLGTGAEDPFITGQVAMCVKGQFDIANMATYNPDLNYGITPIPSKEAGKNITWCGGWGWTVPRGAKSQEQSVNFLAYMMGSEAQKVMAEKTGSFSVLKSVNEEVYADNEQFQVFMNLLPGAYIRPSVPVGQMLWDNLNTVLDSALHEEGTPEQLMKDLDASINAELQKFN